MPRCKNSRRKSSKSLYSKNSEACSQIKLKYQVFVVKNLCLKHLRFGNSQFWNLKKQKKPRKKHKPKLRPFKMSLSRMFKELTV